MFLLHWISYDAEDIFHVPVPSTGFRGTARCENLKDFLLFVQPCRNDRRHGVQTLDIVCAMGY